MLLNNFNEFVSIIFSKSSKSLFLNLEIFSKIYTKFNGVFIFPLNGSGDKYGESVSITILSSGNFRISSS